MTNKQTEREAIKSLHNELAQIVSNLKADKIRLEDLVKKFQDGNGPVLITALEDALIHYERAIYDLEEEIEF